MIEAMIKAEAIPPNHLINKDSWRLMGYKVEVKVEVEIEVGNGSLIWFPGNFGRTSPLLNKSAAQ